MFQTLPVVMYEGINLEKLAKTVKCCNVKTVNVVTPNFGWFEQGSFLHEHARPLTCQRARDQ